MPTDQETYLVQLLSEVHTRNGALMLLESGKPAAVVLSIERYNELMKNDTKVEQRTTILVTGGAGYIGGHVVHTLLAQGYQPVVLDNLVTGRKNHVPESVPFYQGSVGDKHVLREIFANHTIQAVIHLAASLEVEESVAHPEKYFQNNVNNTEILLAEMAEAGISRIIFSSTAAVYGEQEKMPIPETAEPVPNNPYGASKLLAEKSLAYYFHYANFNVTVLRYFNVAGCTLEYGVTDTHRNSHLIPIILEIAKSGTGVFTVFGNDYPTFDGTCVRDYVHVQDVADAHILALQKAPEGFRVYNIGTGKGFSVEQVLQATAEITERMVATQIGERRPGDAAMTVADPTLIKQELGFSPTHSTLEEIIKASWKML